MYRIDRDAWNCPFPLLHLIEETYTALDNDAAKKFLKTVVKPYPYPLESQSATPIQTAAHDSTESFPAQEHITSTGSPSRNKQTASVLMADNIYSGPLHVRESKAKEIQGPAKRSGFSIVRNDEAHVHRVYGSQFLVE